jgi:hypothetical protein
VDWPRLFDTATEDHRCVYGDPSAQAFYWAANDPSALIENLRATRLYVTAGDGVAAEGDVETDPGNPAIERALRPQSEEFVTAARRLGVAVQWEPTRGSHEWPTWRRGLAAALRWGPFDDVPDEPAAWTYDTASQDGTMWGRRFRFDEPPDRVQRFERGGSALRGVGAGGVTIVGPDGAERRAVLPFNRLP